MSPGSEQAERRFAEVFAHLGSVAAYARRRGAADAEAVAAETMTVAWRRLADVPRDDPRPWLYATARNIVWSESRRRPVTTGGAMLESAAAPLEEPASLEPAVATALAALSALDREVLLLVAWEDLTPAQAARSLGIKPSAFRVRLLRARRRFRAALEEATPAAAPPRSHVELELQ